MNNIQTDKAVVVFAKTEEDRNKAVSDYSHPNQGWALIQTIEVSSSADHQRYSSGEDWFCDLSLNGSGYILIFV